MKYIKNPLSNSIDIKKNRIRFKNLDKKAKTINRINKFISYLLIFIYFAFVTGFIYLTKYLASFIENKIIKAFAISGMVIVIIVMPILIIAAMATIIVKFVPPTTRGKLTMQNIQEIAKPLKKYYKIQDSCLVTKCYKCSNQSFTDKDVLIFLYKGKLRITLDFNRTTKDFGCYEFSIEEISISNLQDERIVKTCLKGEKIEFELGRRAAPYLRKIINSTRYLNDLDLMITKYNQMSEDAYSVKWKFFKETFDQILALESKGIIESDKNKKKLSYLNEIIENDGPEFSYIIDFHSALDNTRNYRVGVCVRGTPLIEKL